MIGKFSERIIKKLSRLSDVEVLVCDEKKVYDAMVFDKPNSYDALIQLNYDASQLASILMMLEISGAIESTPGGYYIKK